MAGSDARPEAPGASLSALQDIILAVGSSLDLPTVLQRVVEVIADATGQTDSYIYLYDEESDDLALSAATESAGARWVGSLRIPLGEGVTGWVGATRQTYVVERDLHADPRFVLRPELGEERYDSMICVPIVSRTDRLIGVVSVWAASGDHFSPEHVRLAEWIAVVVAGAIENAQLHASTSRRTRVLERMAELSSMTTSGLATARVLDLVTELAREVGVADLAVMLVGDPSGGDRLILKSAGAGGAAAETLQAVRRELLAVDAEVRRGGLTWHVAAEDVRARLGPWFDASATAPLRVAGEELGLLCCYRVGGRAFTAEDTSLLATIAGQAALALKNALLSEELLGHNELSRFLRDVVAGRLGAGALRERAAVLGLEARSYAFVVGAVEFEHEPTPEWEGAALVLRQVAHALSERVAGVRCTAGVNEVIALVPLSPGEEWLAPMRGELAALRTALRERLGALVTFGISAPADSLEEFRTALAEAREVVGVGARMDAGDGVSTLDDVGHHLLLARAAGLVAVRDRYSVAVETIAEYDRVKRTSLLRTLSVFLDLRNRNEVARALFIHRNTLAQRLARIGTLTGLDLSDSDEWFPLQLALRIHQVRRALEP